MKKNSRDEEVLAEAAVASISNHERCMRDTGSRGVGYKLKYIIWYFILIFVSPYKTVTSDKFIGAMTPVNEKRLKSFCKSDEYYSFARLNSKLRDMKSNRSILSPLKLRERIKLTINAISFYFRHKQRLNGNLHYILEYYAIAEFMIRFRPKEVISPCLYDRYCTLLSYLAHGYEILTIGVQDGAAININVPYKIYCDKMYAFDDYEAGVIKKFIKNDDCKFEMTGFVSYLHWAAYPKKQKKVIAIASQDWFVDRTMELIERMAGALCEDEFDLIVYPHYRESISQYKEIRNRFPGIKIETEVRHSNIDLLVTFYSTIVYDFWSVSSNLKVACIQIPGYSPTYYGRENVKVFCSSEELIQYIKSDILIK